MSIVYDAASLKDMLANMSYVSSLETEIFQQIPTFYDVFLTVMGGLESGYVRSEEQEAKTYIPEAVVTLCHALRSYYEDLVKNQKETMENTVSHKERMIKKLEKENQSLKTDLSHRISEIKAVVYEKNQYQQKYEEKRSELSQVTKDNTNLLNEKNKRIFDLNKRVLDLTDELSYHKKMSTKLGSQLEESEKQNESMKRKLEEQEQEIMMLEVSNKYMLNELSPLKNRVADLETMLVVKKKEIEELRKGQKNTLSADVKKQIDQIASAYEEQVMYSLKCSDKVTRLSKLVMMQGQLLDVYDSQFQTLSIETSSVLLVSTLTQTDDFNSQECLKQEILQQKEVQDSQSELTLSQIEACIAENTDMKKYIIHVHQVVSDVVRVLGKNTEGSSKEIEHIRETLEKITPSWVTESEKTTLIKMLRGSNSLLMSQIEGKETEIQELRNATRELTGYTTNPQVTLKQIKKLITEAILSITTKSSTPIADMTSIRQFVSNASQELRLIRKVLQNSHGFKGKYSEIPDFIQNIIPQAAQSETEGELDGEYSETMNRLLFEKEHEIIMLRAKKSNMRTTIDEQAQKLNAMTAEIQDYQDKIQEYQDETQRLRSTISDLQKNISITKNDLNEYEKLVMSLSERKAEFEDDLSQSITSKTQEYEKRIQALEKENKDLQQKYHAKISMLKSKIEELATLNSKQELTINEYLSTPSTYVNPEDDCAYFKSIIRQLTAENKFLRIKLDSAHKELDSTVGNFNTLLTTALEKSRHDVNKIMK